MMNVILTTYQGAFLGPIARVLGVILDAIFNVLSLAGIENIGICLILFTFLVNALMLPLQVKQQKFAKMSSIMNPEIQAIQAKYKNKKDQASQQKMSLETQAVYQRYGVSPASGCLPLLITFPILFALYRVIYNVPAYVNQVYDIYEGVAKSLQGMDVTVAQLADFLKTKTYVVNTAVTDAGDSTKHLSYYIDVLGQYNTSAWHDLAAKYSSNTGLVEQIKAVSANAANINSFLGMNIADAPTIPFMNGNPLKISVSIPVLSVITQIISMKLSMAGTQQPQTNGESTTANSMKMMNNIMPFVSGVMCFMFPIGVGLYWVAGNVFRIFQSLGINIYFSRVDMDALMEKNIEKSKKRMEKRGIDPNKALEQYTKQKTSNIKAQSDKKKTNVNSTVKSAKKSEYKRPNNSNYKEGSIASYANMFNRDNSSEGKK